MALAPDELLRSLAVALRQRIGPEVQEPFARTQAFMAAVILEKLAGQVANAAADDVAATAERAALVAELRAGAAGHATVLAAVDAVAADGGDAAWNGLVSALYAERDALGAPTFDRLLGRVRTALRARLDRALAYAS